MFPAYTLIALLGVMFAARTPETIQETMFRLRLAVAAFILMAWHTLYMKGENERMKVEIEKLQNTSDNPK